MQFIILLLYLKEQRVVKIEGQKKDKGRERKGREEKAIPNLGKWFKNIKKCHEDY